LNANTRLKIPKYWNSKNAREVWLDGEAFFSVEKKPGAADARFVVHTSDLVVEVLGTSFNVKERNDGTKVVLSMGKVQLNLADDLDTKEDILMQPGELIEFQKIENKLSKKEVNVDNYTAWRNNKLILDNTSMAEIARVMHEIYGVKVYFEDEQLQHIVLNGTSLPTDNQTALLTALSTTLNVSITRKQDKIIFRK
jgi:ferric-dicitrate binding protein FerR (iron transport regulator)